MLGNVGKVSSKWFGMDWRYSQFNEDFIKNYNEESDKGYFLEIDVQHIEKLHELHNDWPFLPERKKF